MNDRVSEQKPRRIYSARLRGANGPKSGRSDGGTGGRAVSPPGYTLIELVMVVTLLGLFVAASAVAFKPVLDTWSLGAPRNEVTDATEYALSRMSYEMTQLRDAASVLAAGTGRFQFTDVSNNVIDYTLSGTNLMRNGNILSRGVQTLSFTYYNVNGATLISPQVSPSPTNIWRIEVSITSERGGQSVTMTSQVRPRNLPRSSG